MSLGAGVSGTIRDRPSWAADLRRPAKGGRNPVIWPREARCRRPVCLTGSCRCGTSVGERVKGRAGPFAPKLPCQRRIHQPAQTNTPPRLLPVPRDCYSVYTFDALRVSSPETNPLAASLGSSRSPPNRRAVARVSSPCILGARALSVYAVRCGRGACLMRFLMRRAVIIPIPPHSPPIADG